MKRRSGRHLPRLMANFTTVLAHCPMAHCSTGNHGWQCINYRTFTHLHGFILAFLLRSWFLPHASHANGNRLNYSLSTACYRTAQQSCVTCVENSHSCKSTSTHFTRISVGPRPLIRGHGVCPHHVIKQSPNSVFALGWRNWWAPCWRVHRRQSAGQHGGGGALQHGIVDFRRSCTSSA